VGNIDFFFLPLRLVVVDGRPFFVLLSLRERERKKEEEATAAKDRIAYS